MPETARQSSAPPRLGGVGLFWRTFILLALLIMCSTVAWLHVFRTQEYEPRVLRNAHQIATVVNLTRNALIHMNGSSRCSSSFLWIHISWLSNQSRPRRNTRDHFRKGN